MKVKTYPLIKALLMWAAMCCMGTVMAQSTFLQVGDSTLSDCHNNGQVFVYTYNGTGPYVYTLAPYYTSSTFNQITQTSSHFTGIPAGYYSITVTDANGLSNASQPGFVAVYSTFYTYLNITPAVCPATTGSETAVLDTPALAYTYLWSTGATTATVTNVPVGAQYTCTVTKTSNGCQAVASNDSFGMYQTSSIVGTINTTPANCRNGTATVVASGGMSPYTYVWNTGATTTNISNLIPNSYQVTITDNQGCSSVAYTYISQGIVITTTTNVTAEHCNDGNGTATITAVNGSAPFTYLWSTGNTTPHITNLTANGYNVTVTDNNGCTASNYAYVSKSTPITASASATLTSCTVDNGTATVSASGGTAPYLYVWSTSPPQTTVTASSLGTGYYNVTVTDAQGCVQYAATSVNQNTTLSMYLTKTNPVCGGIAGSVAANVSGGTGPFTYLWGSGATTSTITGIHQSVYEICTVTDAANCKASQYTYLELGSPIMLSLSTNNASCIYTADGGAAVTAYGGQTPYSYYWSNGQTTQTATSMLTGYYCVNVTDANGCSSYAPFHLGYNSILPCAVTISGTVYDDHDGNCLANGPDQGLTGVWVGCFPNGGYQWTNYYGGYDFVLPPGTYNLAQTPPLYHHVICPATPSNITLTAGQSSTNNDFFNQPDSITDLAINCIPYQQPVAGFTQHVKLFVRNLGTFTTTPDVIYMHSLSVGFLSSSPSPSTYDPATGRIEWSGTTMSANVTNEIDLYFTIPSSLATGYILNNSDTVYPIIGDTSVYNNYEDCQGAVVRAYDPNYIDVLPVGAGAPGYISATKDSLLRYVVHFQNTGNHAATYVTLKTPIDQNLDISTFSLIGTSHYATGISADQNRMLTIRFDNINLPDSGSDRLGSQGFAAFTFKQKKGLQPGNTINETSNIYFDFNTAVPTNTALNTIEHPAGIKDLTAGAFALYPNPTQGNVTLDLTALDESRIQVRIYDMMGRLAIEVPYTSVPASKKLNIFTTGLPTGVYTVEMMGNATYVQKLVKTDK